MAVRLLDLSSEGVLLSCPDPLPPGARRRVIARLGDRPLDAELDVRHVSSAVGPRESEATGWAGGSSSLAPQARLAVDGLLSGSEPGD